MPEKPTYEELEKRIVEIEKAEAEHKLAEQYWRLSNEVLMILNEAADFKDSIQRVLEAVKQTTGCDALGLRLQSGEDFPYFLQSGFSADFLLTENSLLERGRRGEVCRNPDGTVRLECTCGLVISGKVDHSNPLFTPGGSAWTNDSFPFLDLPETDDLRHHPRNQCIHQGYTSIALIPIRKKGAIVGILQVNGHKKGLFTTAAIHALERIASDIGGALLRKQSEEVLRESETKFRGITESTPDAIIMMDHKGSISFWNPAATKILGYQDEEAIGQNLHELLAPERYHEAFRTAFPKFVKTGRGNAVDRTIELSALHKNGHEITVALTLSALLVQEKRHAVGILRDITQWKKMEKKLIQLASTDNLTGLFNRRVFLDRIAEEIARCKRYSKSAVLVMLDLDHFKSVNDTYGHAAGDEVLRHFVDIIRANVREADVSGRLGGEEFALLLPETTLDAAIPVVERILNHVRQSAISTGDGEVRYTASAGFVQISDENSIDDLMARADKALYRAKKEGRDRAVKG